MVRVVGIDHLVVSVSDFAKSKAFYAPLMEFLGFGVEAEYQGSMMGWANGKTLFWIAARNTNTAKAMSAFTIMPSACGAERTSTRCNPSWRSRGRPSSILRLSITTTITPCSSSIPTG